MLRNILLNIQLSQCAKLHNSACLVCAWNLMSLIVLEEDVQRMSEKGCCGEYLDFKRKK